MATPAAVEWAIDKGYVLHLLLHIARCEMKISRAFIADDNPWGLSETDIANWKAYRKAWVDIATGPKKHINFTGTGEDIVGVDRPDNPEGWLIIMRQIGEIPPLACRVSDLDIYDPTLPPDPTAYRKKESVDYDGTWQVGNQFMRESKDD